MPLQSQQSRSFLKSYSGRATLLDSRVSCMRPDLKGTKIHLANQSAGFFAFTGKLKAAFRVSRLSCQSISNSNFIPTLADRVETPFTCFAKTVFNRNFSILSIYQLGGHNGRLASEFKTIEKALEYSQFYGFYVNAYLVLNISGGPLEDWTKIIGAEDAGFWNSPG